MEIYTLTRKEELQSLREQRKNDLILTGIDALDASFSGLDKGCIFSVFGPNGHGKSTFLIALAKHLAKNGYKCFYISTEADEITVAFDYDLLKDNIAFTYMEDLSQLRDIRDYIKQNNIDVVFYDYIGSLEDCGDYAGIRNGATIWNQFVIDTHTALIMAGQADSALLEDIESGNVKVGPNRISFSRHINDKVCQSAYLYKSGEDQMTLYPFKNRWHPLRTEPFTLNIDYNKKEIVEYAFRWNKTSIPNRTNTR